MVKERKPIKAKGLEDWQQEKCLRYSFIKTIKQLQRGGTNKQPTTANEEPLQSNWVGLFDNSITTQLIENN